MNSDGVWHLDVVTLHMFPFALFGHLQDSVTRVDRTLQQTILSETIECIKHSNIIEKR